MRSASGRAWYGLLAVPFAALLFPGLYAHAEPALGGFPFFYWYQFVWLLVTTAIIALVYNRTR
jgi:hypothetical protein